MVENPVEQPLEVDPVEAKSRLHTPDVSISIQDAIKAAKSLLKQSEILKNKIFKNKMATPKI